MPTHIFVCPLAAARTNPPAPTKIKRMIYYYGYLTIITAHLTKRDLLIRIIPINFKGFIDISMQMLIMSSQSFEFSEMILNRV